MGFSNSAISQVITRRRNVLTDLKNSTQKLSSAERTRLKAVYEKMLPHGNNGNHLEGERYIRSLVQAGFLEVVNTSAAIKDGRWCFLIKDNGLTVISGEAFDSATLTIIQIQNFSAARFAKSANDCYQVFENKCRMHGVKRIQIVTAKYNPSVRFRFHSGDRTLATKIANKYTRLALDNGFIRNGIYWEKDLSK